MNTYPFLNSYNSTDVCQLFWCLAKIYNNDSNIPPPFSKSEQPGVSQRISYQNSIVMWAMCDEAVSISPSDISRTWFSSFQLTWLWKPSTPIANVFSNVSYKNNVLWRTLVRKTQNTYISRYLLVCCKGIQTIWSQILVFQSFQGKDLLIKIIFFTVLRIFAY